MRNKALEELNVLVGNWKLTISDASFLESPDSQGYGSATIEWLGDAFVTMRADLDGELTLVIGRSDAQETYEALYTTTAACVVSSQ